MADLDLKIQATDAFSPTFSAFNRALGGIGDAATAPIRALGGIVDTLGKVGLAANGIRDIASSLGAVFSGPRCQRGHEQSPSSVRRIRRLRD